MKKVITKTKEYLRFKRVERNGLITLLGLIVIFFFIPKIFSWTFHREPTDFSAFQQEIAAFEVIVEEKGSTKFKSKKQYGKPVKISPSYFDPNVVTKTELEAMGFSPKAAQTFLNFRKSVGTFKKKTDIKKAYSISDEIYAVLEPYILLDEGNEETYDNDFEEMEEEEIAVELFDFDPNTASGKELQRLGLSSRAIGSIINYRKKGKIYSKEKFRKMNGITEEDYTRLENYIKIEQEEKEKTIASKSKNIPKSYDFPARKPVNIDINTATAEEWQKLRGIGKGYSRKIVNFRNLLGGFVSIEQVGTTYGLPDSTFQAIKPFLKLSSKDLQKININTADYKTLNKHPYIKSNQANVIVNYRKQHGNYQKVADIKKIKLINASIFQKISPYLKVK